MAAGRPTFAKRQRERQRDQKKKDKALKRERRKADKDGSDDSPEGVDPDIAHIKPGPQPLPWDDEPLEDDELPPLP